MKHMRVMTAAVLALTLMASGCGQTMPGAPETTVEPAPEAVQAAPEENAGSVVLEEPVFERPFRGFPEEMSAESAEAPAAPVRVENSMFHAKFEGSDVEGSGKAVDGVYRFTANKTDGEAWHVKLECNYPTIAGRDYFVTYHFRSNVSGTVKFGDFQEFQIHEGENTLTGILIASGGTSYIDLQLGMLSPFTIDFTEIEVKEYADDVEYENALPKPINFERKSLVYEKHDQGYATILARSSDAVDVYYIGSPLDAGVWQSRLYVRTGMVPKAGTHYRVTADIMCDQDMPFEVLMNNGDEEKGYGALYGQELKADEVRRCEAVITGNGNGDELVLQFSLGEAPEDCVVIVGNVHVDLIKDHYESVLPENFALDASFDTGEVIDEMIPVGYSGVGLPGFNYSGTDTVYEQHDDGYVVSLEERPMSATMRISQAPANEADRGVWKAKLFAATGVRLKPGRTYRVGFDLSSDGDQADYEACFDGDSENAYGALYGRSLTAGGTDHVQMLIAPGADLGPLTIRLQLGKTDSAQGNTFTLKNLRVETVQLDYENVLPAEFSYDTGTAKPIDIQYVSVLPESFSYLSGTNVYEQHADGFVQSVFGSGDTAGLKIESAPEEGRDLWNSKLYINTGFTPEAGKKYNVSFDITGEKNQPKYEICFDGAKENSYGALYDRTLSAGEKQAVSCTFVPAESDGALIVRLQLGQTEDTSGNVITVSGLKIGAVEEGEAAAILPETFAYPTVTTTVPEPVEAGYYPVELPALSAAEAHDEGYEQTLEGTSLSVSAVPGSDTGVWKSKLFVNTGTVPEAGAKYRVTTNVTSGKAFDFEICFNNGDAEKGYGALYGQNIGENETKDLVFEFETAEDAALNNLVLQYQLGLTPAGNVFTVNSVTLEKWKDAETPEPVETVTPNSFELWAHEDYAAVLGGGESSVTVRFDKAPEDSREVWKTKLFAETGVTLTAGKSYRISADVQAAAELPYEICYNNGGEEKGVGALYGLTASGEPGTVTFEVTPENDAALVIQFALGNAAAGNLVTISNIKVEERTETIGENLITDELVSWAPVHQWADAGYAVNVTNDDSSATMTVSAVPEDPADWKVKLFVETGAQLKAGKHYRVRYDVEAASAFDYNVFYNNGAEEKAVGEFYGLNTGKAKTVEHTVTPGSDAELNIQLMLGMCGAPNTVKVSNVSVDEIVDPSGSDSVNTPINFWAHEDYAAGLSNTGSSASLAITKVPAEGREAWKIKLFAETGAKLAAGKSYRVSVDVAAASEMAYEICYNNVEVEKELGALYGLTASSGNETVTYNVTPGRDAELILQFNLGNAAGSNKFTISSVKVEEISVHNIVNQIPDFRYNSVGYISKSSDEGYHTTLVKNNGSATLGISHAPAERHTWNVRMNVRTGFTPAAGRGYRVSVNVDCANPQNKFEIFYDGAYEAAYGAIYERYLNPGRNTFSFMIMPGDSRGELTLQLRFGETNGTNGNTYTVSGVSVEEVTFQHNRIPVIRYTSEVVTQEGYSANLEKSAERDLVRLIKTPAEGKEAWKNKLFVNTGVVLNPEQKYRISLNVKSIIPAPFEVCFNNGDVEKGLGAIFGLLSKPYGEFVEYSAYVKDETKLAIQLSLGNCSAPNSIILKDVKVEKAGKINLVSDTVYYF